MAEKSVTAVLLITCLDQKGLVATVSDFIYKNDGNIIHADQHTDREKGVFFQRVEWEVSGFKYPPKEIAKAFEPIASRFNMSWKIHFSDYKPKIAIMVSKQGHCLYDLLSRHQLGEFNADIPIVISNHPDMEETAKNYGVNFKCLPITAQTKQSQEQQVIEALEENKVDLIVLARYMQILSDNFVKHYPDRIINIHHSFLPAFIGANPYNQAYERGVKIIGATAHYVTPELDQGAIIQQDVARVSHRDSVADLVRKGRDLERTVLAQAVDIHLRNRVVVYGNKTVVFS